MMNDKKNNNSGKNKIYIVYIVSFLVLLALTYFFPYSNDDWAWGGKVGIERLSIFFKDYNGRYIGNLLVIILTRFNLIKTLVMSITYFLIALLINKIINKNNNIIFILVLFLLFSMDKVLFRQVIVNTSGFTNYSFSLLLVLFYINHIKNIFTENNKTAWYISILFLILGYITSLFMETVTIYILVLSLSVAVFSIIKFKRIHLSNILYLLGTIFGSICMFSNGAYHHVLESDDFYRTVSKTLYDIVKTAARNYFNQIQNNMISNHVVINVLLCILVLMIIYKYFHSSKSISKHKKIIIGFLGFIVVCFNALILIGKQYNIPLIVGTPRYFIGFSTFVYCFSIILLVLLTIKKDKNSKIIKYKLLFYIASVLILAAPLLIITPVTPRCSLPMFIFMILFVCELLNYIIAKKYYNIINFVLLTMLFVLVVSLFYIYTSIYKANIYRNNEIINQINYHSKTLYIEKNGFEDYVWKNYPVSDTWSKRFLDFYGFDDNYKVKVVPKGSVEAKSVYKYKYNNLMIVAHPDDELLWGGSELINNDYVVVCVTCGVSKVREKEFLNIMRETSDEHIELGYVDTIDGVKSTWDDEYSMIENDLKYIINLKNWDKIVTHNKDGEYGHIHHKMVNSMVTDIAPKDVLYYFGKYYSKKYIDDNNLPITISEEDTKLKKDLFDKYYISQSKLKLKHMFGYEKITKYTNY